MNEDAIIAVRMPQPNVNDEEVTLVNWCVVDGGQAVEGQPLCEVETSKSVGEVPAPASGVVRQTARVGDIVAVGQIFAYVGPSIEAIDEYISSQEGWSPDDEVQQTREPPGATAGAIELARRYGIDPANVPATGKVRRSDVERFIARRGLTQPAGKPAAAPAPGNRLPPALADRVRDEGELSDHQSAIAEHLARTQARLVVAHAVMDASMEAATRWMNTKRQAGVITGPMPILLHAAAAAICSQPKLASFRLGRRVYRYRSIDIAYAARSSDGRLFTPVIRSVDNRGLDELASECGRLSMAVFRGQLEPADMSGSCLTISALSEHPVRLHVGLQNAYQSAILTAGAVHDELTLVDGKPAAIPTITLTLSYDHGLMDGWEAAAALEAARAAFEAIHD